MSEQIDEVKILVKAEVDKAIADLNKTEKQSNSLKVAFRDLQAVMQGPVAAAKMVGDAFSKLAAIGAELYGEFADAELSTIRLNAALDNSDTIAYGASDRLSGFADSLQDVSIFESDATKGIIANLAAMGRSEDQITSLISAASDLASATGQDLDSAVKQLNGTLNGNVGMLGRQNGAIKSLTEEELKSGKAIEIISKQYAGFAKKIGDSAAGEVLQFKNTWGDTKEIIGSIIAANFKPVIAAADKALKEANANALSGLTYARLRNKEELTTEELLTAQSSIRQIISKYSTGNNALDSKSMVLIEAKTKLEAIEAALVGRRYTDSVKALQSEANQKATLADQTAKDKKTELDASQKIAAEAEKALNAKKEQAGWDSLIAIDSENCADAQSAITKELEKQDPIVKGLEDSISGIGDEWGDWTVKIGDTEVALKDLQYQFETIWNAAGEAFGAYQDRINNQHDSEIKAIEDEIEARREAGEDTADIEQKLKDTKNKYAKDEFDSKKLTGIAEAVINTAIGITKVFPNPVLMAIVGALGAIQVRAIAAQQYVPMAQGGIVNSPTHALIGEAGPEAVIPLRGGNADFGKTIVINQNVGGSIVTEKYLTSKAMAAVALANRGY